MRVRVRVRVRSKLRNAPESSIAELQLTGVATASISTASGPQDAQYAFSHPCASPVC